MLKKHNKHGPMTWFAGMLAAAGLLLALPAAQPVYAAGDTGSSDTTVQTAYVGFSAVSDVKVNNVSVKKYGYYTINFDGNDADDGEMPSIADAMLGDNVTLPQNGFIRKGYTFLGWSRTKQEAHISNLKTDYSAGQSVPALCEEHGQSITLYAVWKPNTNTATYHSNLPQGTEKTETQVFLTGDNSMMKDNDFIYPEGLAPGKEYDLTPGTYRWIVPVTGDYTFEMAGGEGGEVIDAVGGKGGYTKGTVALKQGDQLYIHVGAKGADSHGSVGGVGYYGGGGQASDVRVGSDSFTNRIMVAAGGGGAARYLSNNVAPKTEYPGGDGGGLTGDDGGIILQYSDNAKGHVPADWHATGATQTSGGEGYRYRRATADNPVQYYKDYSGFGITSGVAGGSGWYDGNDAVGPSIVGSGSGGSSYIAGYAGTTPFDKIPGGGAVQKSHQFTNAVMTGGTNKGDGYVKVTTPSGITHRFLNWNTNASGTGVSYEEGSSMNSLTGNIDLYAQWENVPWTAPVNTDDTSENLVAQYSSWESDDADPITVAEQKRYSEDCYYLMYAWRSEDPVDYPEDGTIPGTFESHIKIDNGRLEKMTDSEISIMRETVRNLYGTYLYTGETHSTATGVGNHTYAYYKVVPIDSTKDVKVYSDYVSTHELTGITLDVYALHKNRFDSASGAKANTSTYFDSMID